MEHEQAKELFGRRVRLKNDGRSGTITDVSDDGEFVVDLDPIGAGEAFSVDWSNVEIIQTGQPSSLEGK